MTAPSPAPGASPPAPESYTNSDGGFNPGGAAAVSTTASSTTTDIYGLYPYEQQWTFYTAVKNVPGTESPISPNGQDLVPGKLSGTPATEKVQTATAEQLMKEYSLLAMGNQQSRQVWANVQQQLLVSGFYGQSANTDLVKLGTWTNNDANAMLQAMRSYQQVAGEDGSGAPITFAEYLDQTASQAAANGQNASGGYGYEDSGYNISQTDPNAIKDAAQSAA